MSYHKIEAKKRHYRYLDGHEPIRDISVTINHGESVGMIGANGSGKSTLLLLMMCVLFPNHGEVIVGDVAITKKTLEMIRQRLDWYFRIQTISSS